MLALYYGTVKFDNAFILNVKVCKNSVAHSVFRKSSDILGSDISNIIKTMFQRSNIPVDGLDLRAYKIQRSEVYISGYGLYSGKTNERITLILTNFLHSIDVRAIVNVIFITKSISIIKVPTRLRSSTFAFTGVYFRGELHDFGHMGWQKISLGPIRAQKCLISICSVNSIL